MLLGIVSLLVSATRKNATHQRELRPPEGEAGFCFRWTATKCTVCEGSRNPLHCNAGSLSSEGDCSPQDKRSIVDRGPFAIDMTKRRPTPSDFAAAPYDPSLEAAFFRRIVLPNGSFKTTSTRRLDDLNRFVLPYLLETPWRPIDILDVAVSSGVSTQEWHDFLLAEGVSARIIGTDSTIEVDHLPGKTADALFDKNGNLIYLSAFGNSLHPRLLKWLRTLGIGSVLRLKTLNGSRAEPFRLVSKAVETVELYEAEIETGLRSLGRHFHLIRAANILNRAYFSPLQLHEMARRLTELLVPGGLLIVSRTYGDGSNHASLVRYGNSRFELIGRLGRGSEIDDILLI
jgi:hypothetical protein